MSLVKRIMGAGALGAATLIGSGLSAPAQAGYIVTLAQQGTSVVATGSGSIDLASLSFSSSGTVYAAIVPNGGAIVTGPASVGTIDIYSGFAGPTSFGSGGITAATSGVGDLVGINGSDDLLAVPSGYVSNSPLSDSSTYANQTFATLGVTPGTYVWMWGSGATADSFTLCAGVVRCLIVFPAPEPSVLSLLGAGLAGLAFAGIWRTRRRL